MSQLPSHLPPLDPWKPQPTLDAVVSALWRSLCPGHRVGPNHELGPIFAKMSQHPESATLPLYANYFDPVTDQLPNNRLNYNLRLNTFVSWADPEKERERERDRGQHINGACLSRLSQY